MLFLRTKLKLPFDHSLLFIYSLVHHKQNGSPRIDIDLITKYKTDLKGYHGWKAYQQSKLGNILLPKEFAKRYSSMEAVSLHPGGINTNLSRHTGVFGTIWFLLTVLPDLMRTKALAMKSVAVGASTTVTAATTTALVNGAYYDDCEVAEETESAKNMEDAKALFDYCDEATKDYQ